MMNSQINIKTSLVTKLKFCHWRLDRHEVSDLAQKKMLGNLITI